MADLAPVSSSVKAVGERDYVEWVKFGEAVVPGDFVYFDTANQDYRLANNSTAEKSSSKGIVLTPASSGGYGSIATPGAQVDFGIVLTVGEERYASVNSGKAAQRADLLTGAYIARYGIASTTSLFDFKVDGTGVQVP